MHFGENKVQEAIEKWNLIKSENSKLKLHMIGKLQTNKVKNAIKIFDYIHSVDNMKLAKKIRDEQEKIGKKLTFWTFPTFRTFSHVFERFRMFSDVFEHFLMFLDVFR